MGGEEKQQTARSEYVWFAGFSILSALLVLFATSGYGLAVSSDSVCYLSTAQSLVEGEGFVMFTGEIYTLWTPLYPTLLAACWMVFGEAEAAARWMNAGTFALIVWVAGLLFAQALRHRVTRVVGVAAVALSLPILNTSVYVWSDPLFVLLILSTVLALCKYLHTSRSADLIVTGLLLALASLQRYAGLFFVGLAGIAMLGYASGSFLRRARDVVLLGLISAGPIGLWILRNYLQTGSAIGMRPEIPYHPPAAFTGIADSLSAWLVPSAVPLGIRVAWLLIVVGSVVWLLRGRGEQVNEPPHRRTTLGVTAVIGIGWILVLGLYVSATGQAPSDHRLLAPVYVPLFLLLLAALDELFLLLRRSSLRWMPSAAAASLVLWLAYPLTWSGYHAMEWHRRGEGFSGAAWRQSEALRWLTTHEPDTASLYTNDVFGVYYRTGRVVNEIPNRYGEPSPNFPAGDDDHSLYLCFEPDWRGHLLRREELARYANLEPVQRFHDATVYRMTPARPEIP